MTGRRKGLDMRGACAAWALLITGALLEVSGCAGRATTNGAGSAEQNVGGSTAGGSGGMAGQWCTQPITFDMFPASGTTPGAFCVDCSAHWLSLTDAQGEDVQFEGEGCQVSCDTCAQGPCALLPCATGPVLATGMTRQWDGTVPTNGTCGASHAPCLGSACARSGKYLAKMCAFKASASSLCGSPSESVCTEVPFTLGSGASRIVTGIIGG